MNDGLRFISDVEVNVPEFGTIMVDIVYGGLFFAIVRASSLGLDVNKSRAQDLIRAGDLVKSKVRLSWTYWGRVTYIYASVIQPALVQTMACLSPGWRQVITLTNAGIGPLGTNFSEILIAIHTFSEVKSSLHNPIDIALSWWRHQMEIFSALLALCAGNSPVTGEFPSQRPVTGCFYVFFDLGLIKRLSKQSWGWWFKTPSRSLWRHCNVISSCSMPEGESVPPCRSQPGVPPLCDVDRW